MTVPGSHRHDDSGSADRARGPLGNRGTSRGATSAGEPPEPAPSGIHLRSPAFSDHAVIPDRYSYDGGNSSPPLEWEGVPDDAEELALLCVDPDAPSGAFVHWVVSGIPPRARGVGEGELPEGAVVGRNDFGQRGWGGPKPPVGDEPHRYFFRLYAADRPLGLGEGATATDLRKAAAGHEVASGTLIGLFGR